MVQTVDDLRSRFAPIFASAAADAARNDLDRVLPFDAVEQLKRAGFGTLLVPVSEGGLSGSYETLTALLIELAAADPNIAQIFRSHFHVVETILAQPAGPFRERWLGEILKGSLFSNGVTDAKSTAPGESAVRIDRTVEPARLSGAKHYSTGSLFAEWLLVLVNKTDAVPEAVIVATGDPAVSIDDTWNGFGQRVTSTGTTRFDAVVLEDWQFVPPTLAGHRGDLLQLVLLAVTAGIARSVKGDLVAALRRRTRVYSHGSASHSQQDPQVLQTVGEVAAAADAAETIVLALARKFDDLAGQADAGGPESGEQERQHAQLVSEVYSAQTIVPRLTLDAATQLFDALGASATDRGADLDRHWRNARTVASHNPIIFRTRILGDWLINGEIDTRWSVGETRTPDRVAAIV